MHPTEPTGLAVEILDRIVSVTSDCIEQNREEKQKEILRNLSFPYNVCNTHDRSSRLHSENRQRNVQFHEMIVQLQVLFSQNFVANEVQLANHFQFRFVEIILRCLRQTNSEENYFDVTSIDFRTEKLTVGVAGKYPEDDGIKSFIR